MQFFSVDGTGVVSIETEEDAVPVLWCRSRIRVNGEERKTYFDVSIQTLESARMSALAQGKHRDGISLHEVDRPRSVSIKDVCEVSATSLTTPIRERCKTYSSTTIVSLIFFATWFGIERAEWSATHHLDAILSCFHSRILG